MAISIVSGTLSNLVGNTPNAPTFGTDTNGNSVASFAPNGDNNADGVVVFSGLPADSRAGWEVGFIQTEWVETNWANYRGQFDRDGGIFLQRGRAPARAQQACRDTQSAVGTFFTKVLSPTEHKTLAGSAGVFPAQISVSVTARDGPGDLYQLFEVNSKTNKVNYLQAVQLEFLFCTVLTVRNPVGVFFHQAHFFWNLRWQYTFQPKRFPPAAVLGDWTITPVAGGNGGTMGHAIAGAPSDRRFSGVLTLPQTVSCNDLAVASTNAVETVGNGCRRESLRWASVDVRI